MAKEYDDETARTARADARRLESEADATGPYPYPYDTAITRPNRASHMFNLRLTDEQFRSYNNSRGNATCRWRQWHDPDCWTGPPRPRTPDAIRAVPMIPLVAPRTGAKNVTPDGGL
jgi:hypothetical protein